MGVGAVHGFLAILPFYKPIGSLIGKMGRGVFGFSQGYFFLILSFWGDFGGWK